ncbi:MAG: hypothetical protein AAFN77_18135 [Planctomycetota bacterium]
MILIPTKQNVASGLQLHVVFGTNNSIYPAVTKSRLGNQPRFEFDEYSYHYLLKDRGQSIGTVTVTRNPDGRIDCQQFYPNALFTQFGDRLCSTCKFYIRRNTATGLRALRFMIRGVWQHQVSHGMRLDVINATPSHIRFYQRIGYSVVANSGFRHPLLGTRSVVMIMATDPDVRSFVQDLFVGLKDQLSLDAVRQFIKTL